MTSAGKNFNHQEDRTTYSVDTSWLPSTINPLIAQWAHERSDHGGGDRGDVWLSNKDFHSPRLTWLQPELSAPSASSRDQYRVPHMPPFSRVISQTPDGRLATCIASITEGAALRSYRNRCFLWLHICLSYTQGFCHSCHLWTYRMSFPP